MTNESKIVLEEEKEELTIDADEDEPVTDIPGTMHTEEADQEAEFLDRLTWPGMPTDERVRREKWLSFPQSVRTAVRRLHEFMGQKRLPVIFHVMKGARVDPQGHGGGKVL